MAGSATSLEAGTSIEDMVRFIDPDHLSVISLIATYRLPGGFGPRPLLLLLRLAMLRCAPRLRCVGG
jgi:hypothetical protein